MSRRRHLLDLHPAIETLFPSLERALLRRRIPHEAQAAFIDASDSNLATEYEIGKTYGRYGERIVRRVLSRESGPSWFDPREHPGQYGMTLRSGLRIFLEVAVDEAARNAPSTFDREIRTLAVPRPAQGSLFEIL